MKLKTAIFIGCALALIAAGCKRRPPKDFLQESRKDKAVRMAWWKEARFGLFIHWGLYAIPAGTYNDEQIPRLGEWIMNNAPIPVDKYEELAPKFNPTAFDADAWVTLAKKAGMKYIIITSKHHDGFCLWDSKVTDWDVIDRTPFKRDILRELVDACERHGMRLGFYYSIMDWHHPKAQGGFYPKYDDRERMSPTFSEYAEKYMKPQIKELIKGYGDVAVLWFDGQWIADWNGDKGRMLYNYVRNLKSSILVNNRVGRDRPDPYISREQELIGDFGTPEQYIPETGMPDLDWESCITMNDTWGYKSYDDNWKSSELLVRVLVDIVSKGGNLLLNVGPTAEGRIPAPSIERLEAIGRWMEVNGESIYGASASPFGGAPWGRYTTKGTRIFAHVFGWPKDGKLVMHKPRTMVSKIYLLSDPKKTALSFTVRPSSIVVEVPQTAPDTVDSVVVVATRAH
jgi:alpha-L-fucosidase